MRIESNPSKSTHCEDRDWEGDGRSDSGWAYTASRKHSYTSHLSFSPVETATIALPISRRKEPQSSGTSTGDL